MAPISPGRPAGPSQKRKRQTATIKTFRFEPFSKRIARLKIDPIHSVVGHRQGHEDLNLSESHFGTAFRHWADLNQSETYRHFSLQVCHKCQSLSQILYYSDTICESLVSAIEKKDENALEPLLNLAEAFAHDLGEKFERYLAQIVTLVLQVASSHSTADVIEWCFNCVTWILRFLSRLLVPDLTPLLAIMLPYLGAEKQRHYIVRFAAESLAFLLRKAAMKHSSHPQYLTAAVQYLLVESQQRMGEEGANGAYQVGIMTLISETAMGVDGTVHSSAPALVCTVMKCVLANELSFKLGCDILEGTMIGLIHQTSASGFEPVFEGIEIAVRSIYVSTSDLDVRLLARLVHVVVGTRMGTRITDWSKTVNAVLHLGSVSTTTFSRWPSALMDHLTTTAMLMQYAPMDELLPHVQKLLESAKNSSSPAQFLAFCDVFAKLGRERYTSLFIPHFQTFVLSQWQQDQDGLLLLLRNLRSYGICTARTSKSSSLACPISWEIEILERCRNCANAPNLGFDVRIDGFMQLAVSLKFPREEKASLELENILHTLVQYGLDETDLATNAKARFALGRGFQTYLQLSQSSMKIDTSFWDLICKRTTPAFGLQPFLHGLRWYAGQTLSLRPLAAYEQDRLRTCLLENLAKSVTTLKLLTVQLMKDVFSKDDQWLEQAFSSMTALLETPYTITNGRQIVVQLRELQRLQKRCSSVETWGHLLPIFCMGLMPHYHATPLEELCSAIGQMCAVQTVEEYVTDTCIKWLQAVDDAPIPSTEDEESHTPELQPPSFQCSNVLSVGFTTQMALEAYSNAEDLLKAAFANDHQVHSGKVPPASRRLALQLLLNIPQLAEKRSRLLVPLFLSAHAAQQQSKLHQETAASVSSYTLSPELSDQTWSYADRKLLLELFGRFTNPAVLYCSDEVHKAILELLKHGGSEMQEAALRALFTWKQPSIKPYEDTLLRLLNSKADSSELNLLLHPDAEQSSIEAEHRVGLLPVLLTLVFGLMTNRSKSKGPQEGKRKAILRKVFDLPEDEVIMFLKISFGSLARLSDIESLETSVRAFGSDLMSIEQQHGFLRTMHTMFSILKTRILPFGNIILPPILYCLSRACRQINKTTSDNDNHIRQMASALVHNTRKIGLGCLAMAFEYCNNLDWSSYMPIIFVEVVRPRLSTLAIDTAQGISGLLRLLATWSKSEKTVIFLQQDPQLMLGIIDCLNVKSAKNEVKLFALNDIILNVAKLTKDDGKANSEAVSIIRSNVEPLLVNLNILLKGGPSQNILEAVVNMLPMLAPFTISSSQAQALLSTLAAVLGKGQKIGPQIKGGLLAAAQSLLQDHYKRLDGSVLEQVFQLTSSLFNYFKDDANRTTLCAIIETFGQSDKSLAIVSKICQDLNMRHRDQPLLANEDAVKQRTSSKKSQHARLGEIDYDQHIGAFSAINGLKTCDITAREWSPILHNLIYFIRSESDFSIRSNAVACLRNFIIKASSEEHNKFDALMQNTLLPAIGKGLKEPSETIRADFVALLGTLVEYSHGLQELQDMRVLLAGGDAEASFYLNILHIQQHRRLRAIRRLTSLTEEGALQGRNLSQYFIPLLERFVFDNNEDESSLTLKGQAIVALSSLLKWIEWTSFRVIFRRYRGLMDSKALKDKDAMKLLNGAIDALSNARTQMQDGAMESPLRTCLLSSTIASEDFIRTELGTHFIPKLTMYIKHNDEAQASLRLPASIVAIKAILMLPPVEATFMIPDVLLVICNILRSRDQEIRDEARNTLASVSSLLGPRYLHLVVKELQTALNRGYQVHVLTYTIHKIVITVMPQLQPGDLDYCLPQLTSLLIGDIFGSAGLDKDNDDYISSMKEVKGNKKNSKSFSTIEALAEVTGVKRVSSLLEPLRLLLTGTLRYKQQQHADEVLRRIGVGLAHNPAAGTRDMLMLSYQLIKDLYTQEDNEDHKYVTTDEQNKKRYLIQANSNHKISNGSSSPDLFKIHRFALDLVRSSLQRHQHLLTAENVHGFLPVIGDALVSKQEDIKISAFRLLAAIIKLDIPELSSNAALYVNEAIQAVANSSNMNADGPQAALKLVASMLREKPAVEVRRRDLEYLLHKMIPDLEEPDRQGSSFNLIKAVMAREVQSQNFELPEMYEMADKVSVMMVSNHSQSARDIARGVYVHFLLEYPQTKKRWEKQLKFLAENLEYQYPEGRQNVMEAINVLLTKLGSERAQELIPWFFLPLVLRLANDDSERCRDMAGALLAQLFTRANATELEKMLQSMREWIGQTDEPALTVTGMQAYSHLLQAVGPQKEAVHVRTSVESILLTENKSILVNSELRLQTLKLFAKLVSAAPVATLTQRQAGLWSAVRSMLSETDPEIQSAAASLISAWFQDVATANSKPELKLHKVPLTGSHGLPLDRATMVELLKAFLRALRHLDAASATMGPATVQNLLFLARCLDANKMMIDISKNLRADFNSEADSEQDAAEVTKTPAIQYLLHQLSAILRREIENLTSTALAPKTSTLQLLHTLIPHLSHPVISHAKTLNALLLPLRHLTADDFVIPKSSDPTFESAYTLAISSAHEVIEAIHSKVGDAEYVRAMTQVSREVRDRREERRKKRRIDAMVDPERAAGKKARKNGRKSGRRKEVAGVHRNRRSLV